MSIGLWMVWALAALWYGAVFGLAAPSVLRSGVKTLPLAALLGIALLSSAPPALSLALLLSALGDLALSRPGARAVLAGMGAFGAAHLAYVALFWQAGASVSHLLALPQLMGALALILLAVWTARRLAPRAGTLGAPLCAYAAVIAAMGLGALALPSGFALAVTGAALFVASDLILGEQMFGTPRGPWADRLLWVLYVAGQGLLTLAFLA